MNTKNEAQNEAKNKAKFWSYRVRQQILELLCAKGPLCRRDMASLLALPYTSISPRISELHNDEHKIRNSGKRKTFPYIDRDGNNATTSETIWELVNPNEDTQSYLFDLTK